MAGILLSLALAVSAQTAGPEQLVGWSMAAGWWDCGDLGSDWATTIAYHWPQWLIQVAYAQPDTHRGSVHLDADIWSIDAFRLWRATANPRRRSWVAGLGLSFCDVGTDATSAGQSRHDTSSDWGLVALAGVRWPSGWYLFAEYGFGADVTMNMPDGSAAHLDLDGPRILLGRRF